MKKVVGLELFSRSIRGVEVHTRSKKSISVEKFFEMPIDSGIVKDNEVLDDDLLANVLKEFWKLGKFSTKNVVVGMGNQRIIVRKKTVPLVSLSNIKSSLPFLVSDEIPVDLDAADFAPISVGDDPREVEGLLVAGVKGVSDKYYKSMSKAKLNLVSIDLIPFALVRALPYSDETENNILLGIDSQTTSITIIENNMPVFVRFIPYGSDLIVEGIQKLTGLEYDKALQLRDQIGIGANPTDEKAANVAKVINAQTNNLYKDIRNTIRYYREQNPDKVYNTITMCGSGLEIKGLEETFTRALSMKNNKIQGKNNISFNKKCEIQEVTNSVILPIGLALGVLHV